jgi:hypothetical protein
MSSKKTKTTRKAGVPEKKNSSLKATTWSGSGGGEPSGVSTKKGTSLRSLSRIYLFILPPA